MVSTIQKVRSDYVRNLYSEIFLETWRVTTFDFVLRVTLATELFHLLTHTTGKYSLENLKNMTREEIQIWIKALNHPNLRIHRSESIAEIIHKALINNNRH